MNEVGGPLHLVTGPDLFLACLLLLCVWIGNVCVSGPLGPSAKCGMHKGHGFEHTEMSLLMHILSDISSFLSYRTPTKTGSFGLTG